MTTRRDPFTFDAFDPKAGTCKVHIREQRLLTLARVGKWHLLDARSLVPQVLGSPTVIFEGLRWEGDEDRDRPGWRCYCGKPATMYDKRCTEVSADPKQVFLVFVNDKEIVYMWRWEFADEDDQEIPKDSNIRFRVRVFDKREDA